jgi:hypothetical protein
VCFFTHEAVPSIENDKRGGGNMKRLEKDFSREFPVSKIEQKGNL